MQGKWFLSPLLFILTLFFNNLGAIPKDPNYPLGRGILFSKSISYIQRYYLEPKRIDSKAMFEGALSEIQKSVPEVLANCDSNNLCALTAKQAMRRFSYPTSGLQELQTKMREVFQFLEQNISPDTEKKEIEYAAIVGMLQELDPHSNFLTPEAFNEFRVGTEGEFGGLGIVIGLKEGRLTVTAPIEGTPAWRAGVKPGDFISQIDEESTINMSLTEAVQKLRGPVGTAVTLKIEREGKTAPLSIILKRDIINIEAVQSKRVQTSSGKEIGFIRVKSFQANTQRDFILHLKRFLTEEPKIKGIVLDLRNNPGGLLDQAIFLSDVFLKRGTIVATVGAGNKPLEMEGAKEEGLEIDLPLIVLVNEGSASASEIVAGALKNNDRALIVGSKTFGKGSVQSIYELPMDAALKLTVAQYLTPGNQSIQSVGITPDIDLFPVIVSKNVYNTMENIQTTEKDLEKHLDQQLIQKTLPSFKLHYLESPPKENEGEEMQYKTTLELKGDTASELAIALMDTLASNHRDQMLKEATPLLEKKQTEEEKKIVGAFEQNGIQWGAGPLEGHPQAELSYNLFKDGKKVATANAGETITLRLNIKNVGKGTFYRLVAQTDSKDFFFKNLEFPFGKINPGETKTSETEMKVPLSTLTEDLELTLQFFELHKETPAPLKITLPIQGLPRPHFAHQISLEAGWKENLKKGMSIPLTFQIQNKGLGSSKKPTVILRNLGGKEIFLEKGRVVLNELKPNQISSASFRLHMDPTFQGDKIHFELSIIDGDLIVSSEQEITLDLASGSTKPTEKLWQIPPQITLKELPTSVSKTPYPIQGEVQDDQHLKDVYIFVDEKKSYYAPGQAKSSGLPLKTMIPLKKGNNIITITARDSENLISRKHLILYFDQTHASK